MTHPLVTSHPFESSGIHVDGTPCTCVYSSAQWWRKHWTLAQVPSPVQQVWLDGLAAAVEAFGEDREEI